MTFETAFSFPGIGLELKIIVSFGLMEIFLCMPNAILERAAMDSPWLPVVINTVCSSGKFFKCSTSINVFSGISKYPSSVAVEIILTMLRPSTTTFLLYLQAELIICWTRSTLDANVATIILECLCSEKILSNALPTELSVIVNPGRSAFVLSHISASTPFLPISPSLARSMASPNTGV